MRENVANKSSADAMKSASSEIISNYWCKKKKQNESHPIRIVRLNILCTKNDEIVKHNEPMQVEY